MELRDFNLKKSEKSEFPQFYFLETWLQKIIVWRSLLIYFWKKFVALKIWKHFYFCVSWWVVLFVDYCLFFVQGNRQSNSAIKQQIKDILFTNETVVDETFTEKLWNEFVSSSDSITMQEAITLLTELLEHVGILVDPTYIKSRVQFCAINQQIFFLQFQRLLVHFLPSGKFK